MVTAATRPLIRAPCRVPRSALSWHMAPEDACLSRGLACWSLPSSACLAQETWAPEAPWVLRGLCTARQAAPVSSRRCRSARGVADGGRLTKYVYDATYAPRRRRGRETERPKDRTGVYGVRCTVYCVSV